MCTGVMGIQLTPPTTICCGLVVRRRSICRGRVPPVAKPPPSSGTREPSTKTAGSPDVATVPGVTLETFRSSEPASSKIPALKNEFQVLDGGSRIELVLKGLTLKPVLIVLEPEKLQLTVEPPPSVRVRIIWHRAMLGNKVTETISVAKTIFVVCIILPSAGCEESGEN